MPNSQVRRFRGLYFDRQFFGAVLDTGQINDKLNNFCLRFGSVSIIIALPKKPSQK